MAAIQPIAPVGPAPLTSALLPPALLQSAALPPAALHAQASAGTGFGDLLASGLAAVDARVAKADALVAAFAKGNAIPVHEVTLALEQARLAVELAAEVRSRLLEAYRDFMTMQI